jgi:golgi SNAP receptor complex member 1
VSSTTDDLLSNSELGQLPEETVLARDIQRTLTALSDLIQQGLSPAAEKSGKSQHLLLVKRYREILFDYTSDFNKTSATLTRKKEHSELFQNRTMSQGESGDDAMEQLLRERSSINNSMETSASIINQASGIYGDLKQQGMSLKNVGGAISRITGNIPGLNRIVDNIRRKRSRDDYIVAGVIAACVCLTLWYIFG